MSKSGLFAHFGSKEELQLATIETASALFTEQVIEPALAAPTGLERLRQLAEGFLRHVEDGVFPGGCFFASVAAEMDTHPGPVRDLAVQVVSEWCRQLETAVRDAQAEGAIDPAEDAEQLAFELDAYLLLANAQFVVSQEPTPIDRARRAVERRLAAATDAARPGITSPRPTWRARLTDAHGDHGIESQVRRKVVMAPKAPDFRRRWAILDSNQGPPPYQSGALTN